MVVPELTTWESESLSGEIMEWLVPRGSSDGDESGMIGNVMVTGRRSRSRSAWKRYLLAIWSVVIRELWVSEKVRIIMPQAGDSDARPHASHDCIHKVRA